jgi:uncharacterized protein
MSTYLPEGLPRPAPARDGVDAEFWEGLKRHELRVQRCASCGRHQHPAEWLCTWCGSGELQWTVVAAEGTVHTWTRVHHPAHPALRERGPYDVVVVEPSGAPGVLVLGNLVEGRPEIGAAVRGVFEDHEGYTLLHWR